MSDQKQIFEGMERKFLAILEQMEEFQEDCEKHVRVHRDLKMPEIYRLFEHFLYVREIVFRAGFGPLLGEQWRYYNDPSLKHMIMAQIRRLEGSSDTIDKGLVDFLKATYKNKKYTYVPFSRPDVLGRLARQALDRAKEKNISQAQAARDVAKGTKYEQKTIENEIKKIKNIKEEMDSWPSRESVNDTD